MSHRYVIRHTVEAATRLEAIAKATGMLRSDCKVNGVHDAVETRPGWWDVALSVTEDT